MKKNLRIVSAAAAALLAVAPVAASAVSVNAASTNVSTVTSLGQVNLSNDAVVNIKPNISLNTAVGNDVDAAISVSFTATVDGTTATSNFTPNASTVELWKDEKNQLTKVTNLNQVIASDAGTQYQVHMTNVGLNFGSQNANKEVTLKTPAGDMFNVADASQLADSKDTNAMAQSHRVKLDKNGTITLKTVVMSVTAKNFANPAVVEWYSTDNGKTVSNGNVTLYSGSDAGKMNVAQVAEKISQSYKARSMDNTAQQRFSYTTASEIASQLKAEGTDVDGQGWFVAPKSFTVNYKAMVNKNDAASTLTVTVNVPNGKDTTVPSQPKTIMHNAYFYDKDAKRVGTDKLTRYNSVNVAMSTTKIGDKTYYEVVENGKLSGKFINADNIDGTKRTLKHNAYVYKSSKKRANKVVLKKGEEVTTYGGTYTFKNGKQYYKIGNNTDKTYVKASNF